MDEHVFVLGGSMPQAERFARLLGLHPRRQIISDLRHLVGVAHPTVLLVGSWRNRSHIFTEMDDWSHRATFLEVVDLARVQ